MGKRFAIVIGVAAAGVMALGAQAATSTTGERGGDLIPPNLQLSGDKTQNPQADGPICDSRLCDVIVHVRCGHQRCTARAKGRLTQVNIDRLESDGPWVINPGREIGDTGPAMEKPKQRKQVRRALDNGKTVLAKITVRAKDAAGNVATAKRTIRLVKSDPRNNRPAP